MWENCDNGASIGTKGSENGIITLDEEYNESARVTIEKDTDIAPFSITCGIYGSFFHTTYLGTNEEALSIVEKIKTDISYALGSRMSREDMYGWIDGFVARY